MFDISPNVVLLAGVVGSTAYGLAGPDSDVDRLGMYAAPTLSFHGLNPPVLKTSTISSTKPDITMHEAGKFAHLCLGSNPTAMELLWLESYETLFPLGRDLIDIRTSFLSAKRVRNAYMGYAIEQFKAFERRGDGSFGDDLRKRTAKHARHLMRLCHQGLNLYRTGRLVIRLEDPEAFILFGEEVAGGNIELAKSLIVQYEESFDSSVPAIPDSPDESVVERWLLRVRAANL